MNEDLEKERGESTEPETAKPQGPPSETSKDLLGEKTRFAAELEDKEREYKDLYDRYIRTVADFENYKKRAAKEQIEFSKFSNEKLLRELLPVLDNLERAITHSRGLLKKSGGLTSGRRPQAGAEDVFQQPPIETQDVSKLIEGVELIQKQFLATLSKFGVTVLESLGQSFDPHLHQAVSQLEENEMEENRVVAEPQKGYLLYDRLLRPAMVVVSKKREAGTGTDSGISESGPEEHSDRAT